MTVGSIVAFLLSLPVYHLDRTDDAASRAGLVEPVAQAIALATDDPRERAFLAAQAYSESGLARYVLEERCADGPAGSRCDGGRATGPWQVHAWCAGAWRFPTRVERFASGARCSLKLYRLGLERGNGDRACAFQYQLGAGSLGVCRRERWERRLRLWDRAERELGNG